MDHEVGEHGRVYGCKRGNAAAIDGFCTLTDMYSPTEEEDAQALSMAAITAGVTLRSAATRSTEGSYGMGAENIVTQRASSSEVVNSEEDWSE